METEICSETVDGGSGGVTTDGVDVVISEIWEDTTEDGGIIIF